MVREGNSGGVEIKLTTFFLEYELNDLWSTSHKCCSVFSIDEEDLLMLTGTLLFKEGCKINF